MVYELYTYQKQFIPHHGAVCKPLTGIWMGVYVATNNRFGLSVKHSKLEYTELVKISQTTQRITCTYNSLIIFLYTGAYTEL